MSEVAGCAVREDEDRPVYYGYVIIEWPAPVRKNAPPVPLTGWRCVILDAVTGKPVNTVSKLKVSGVAVTADAESWITADLTMFADEDGKPVLDGEPVLKDGEILTGTFPFYVAEMRVRP